MPGNIISITPADMAAWPTPNYVDPVERAWMPAYAGTLYGVSTLMIFLRLWLRVTKQAGGLGLDDALVILAWLGSTMFTTVSINAAVNFDIGRHIWDVPLKDYEKIAETTWLAELSFLICGGATKISILLFYRRLVDVSFDKRWKWAVVSAVLFTAAWTIAFILTLCFNCTPTEAYWRAFSPSYHHKYSCVDTTAINLLAGIFAVSSDIYSVALPLIMTRRFGLPTVQKAALNIIFSLGLLVVAASAVRTYYLYEVGQSSDVSWMVFNVIVWSQVELQLGIICATLPALRVFFRRYLNEPIARIIHETNHSVVSRQSNRISGRSSLAIRRLSTSEDQYQRDDDFGIKEAKGLSETSIAEEEVNASSPSSTTASTHHLIKTPADYEAYNLRNLEKHRQSAIARSGGRGRDAQNFSQPFNPA